MSPGRPETAGGAWRRTFAWRDTAREVAALAATRPHARFLPARGGFELVDGGQVTARMLLPLVLRHRHPGEEMLDDLLRRLDQPLGRECVVLLRAGDAALGLWRDGELVAHKTFARYVVRGHGRAQPAYAKTRGKSRYGARLRLQNARRLLTEVNERLAQWWTEASGFDAVYLSCPKRLWPELRNAAPGVCFDGILQPIAIPLHVHRPRHEELLRVRRALEHGAIETYSSGARPGES